MSEASVIARLASRVRLSIGRAVLRGVNDARKLQAVQVEIRAGEVRDGAEHFQTYGLTSKPFVGAEGIALAVGGSTDHMVVICVDDRRYRVKGLADGEVCLYTDEDAAAGQHRIHFKRGNIIEMVAGASSIVMGPAGIVMTAPSIDFNEG